MAEPFRGEHWELSYGPEASYGDDPGTSELVIPFGVFDRGQMADPEIEQTPFFGGGGAQARRFFRTYRGKWNLEANIGDVMLLNAMSLVLPIGTVATTGPVGGVYTHTFTEATVLKSITAHVSAWLATDAGGSPTLMRRFLGGKVNRMTLSAEENERLKMSIDSLIFKDLRHNISTETLKYDSGVARPTVSYPDGEPFFFSGGLVQISGVTYARIKSFRLEVNNNAEAKYYITGSGASVIPTPYSVLEGKREYNLTIVVEPEDTALYKLLMEQGRDGSGNPDGLKIVLSMYRHATDDYIKITMPNDTALSLANQGCFIKRGRMDIDSGTPAVPQELEIAVRQCTIEVKDDNEWTALSD